MINFPCLLFISGGPGSLELLVVFLVILVLFGPHRMPDIARSIGRILKQLRGASQEFKDQIMRIEKDAATAIDIDIDVDEGYEPFTESDPETEPFTESDPEPEPLVEPDHPEDPEAILHDDASARETS